MVLVRLFVLAALVALAPALAPAQDGNAGAYLAARVAASNAAYREAAAWYTRALLGDPMNAGLMDGAIVALTAAGNVDGAVTVARRMEAAGAPSQAASLVLMADEARRGDWATLRAKAAEGRSIGKLLDALALAWAELGEGRMSQATAAFDGLAATRGLEAFGLYHKALALASVGDFEGADGILAGRAGGTLRLTRRGVIAHAEILAQLDRPADAAALVGEVARDAGDPGLAALGDRLAAGEPIPWTSARNATEGMAEVFFTLALALNGEADPGYTLLYARIAAWLRPDHAEAVLLAASMLEEQQQFDLAVETYTAIPPDNASAFAAEIGRARALEAAGRGEAAVEVLRAVARGYPDLLSVHVALGDALRRMERWDEAAPVYETAVVLLGTPQPEHWSLFFSRAIVFERMKVWDRAEPDFRQALALNPDQPQVLNYLGYSFLEQNRNLDEALGMIERAVAQSPDSGYIVDSLAWGLFRLGRYAEAVEPMERASLLEPVDPVVTDHLGDIYWAVGRKMEARFQWRRALSFGPEEKEAARIRRKLEVGLDAVLAEEGLPSLAEVAARSGVPDAN
jgi:tetratricopeptide (TPR) repeat protein